MARFEIWLICFQIENVIKTGNGGNYLAENNHLLTKKSLAINIHIFKIY